jgi:hypothetical protein
MGPVWPGRGGLLGGTTSVHVGGNAGLLTGGPDVPCGTVKGGGLYAPVDEMFEILRAVQLTGM